MVRALLIGSIPLAAAFGVLGIAQLFAVALLTGLATVLFQVAYLAYLPSLLARDELIEGNAKLQGSGAVAQVVGPGVGGWLVQVLRAPFALIADAASYVVSVVALLAIRAREPLPVVVERRSLRNEIVEGARCVLADPLLRVLTISPAVGNFFHTGYGAISVLFLVRTVHLAPASVGLGFYVIGSVTTFAGVLLVASPLHRMGDLPDAPPEDSALPENAAAMPHT